jgi:hypothetical protein
MLWFDAQNIFDITVSTLSPFPSASKGIHLYMYNRYTIPECTVEPHFPVPSIYNNLSAVFVP